MSRRSMSARGSSASTPDGKILRVEEAGRRFAAELGIDLKVGGDADARPGRARIAGADGRPAVRGDARAARPRAHGASLLRTDPLGYRGRVEELTFSGGVSEFIYGNEAKKFGDLGPLLAAEIRARVETFCPRLERRIEGIRATVVGASQYTIQLSGSTIYVSPLDALPLRNVPVIAPALPLDGEVIDPSAVARAITDHAQAARSRRRRDAGGAVRAVARLGDVPAARRVLPRRGRGTARGLARGHPLMLAGDGDVGGLIGIHLREEMKIANAIVSIDGLELKEFDYIDIGAMLDASGAVPVVIKSLIFPGSAAAKAAPR